eukprot:scaffold673_cov410-Prasinococcus_capsulatus_cf.AAC.13
MGSFFSSAAFLGGIVSRSFKQAFPLRYKGARRALCLLHSQPRCNMAGRIAAHSTPRAAPRNASSRGSGARGGWRLSSRLRLSLRPCASCLPTQAVARAAVALAPPWAAARRCGAAERASARSRQRRAREARGDAIRRRVQSRGDSGHASERKCARGLRQVTQRSSRDRLRLRKEGGAAGGRPAGPGRRSNLDRRSRPDRLRAILDANYIIIMMMIIMM